MSCRKYPMNINAWYYLMVFVCEVVGFMVNVEG
jgi:hypothetical protein